MKKYRENGVEVREYDFLDWEQGNLNHSTDDVGVLFHNTNDGAIYRLNIQKAELEKIKEARKKKYNESVQRAFDKKRDFFMKLYERSGEPEGLLNTEIKKVEAWLEKTDPSKDMDDDTKLKTLREVRIIGPYREQRLKIQQGDENLSGISMVNVNEENNKEQYIPHFSSEIGVRVSIEVDLKYLQWLQKGKFEPDKQQAQKLDELFFNPELVQPCVDILNRLEMKTVISEEGRYVGNLKSILVVWLEELEGKFIPGTITDRKQKAELLKNKFPGLNIDDSMFAKNLPRAEKHRLDIKALLSQVSQSGK